MDGDDAGRRSVLVQTQIATRDGDVVFTYAGVVSGDKFTGTAEVGGFQVPYNGVRTKSGK